MRWPSHQCSHCPHGVSITTSAINSNMAWPPPQCQQPHRVSITPVQSTAPQGDSYPNVTSTMGWPSPQCSQQPHGVTITLSVVTGPIGWPPPQCHQPHGVTITPLQSPVLWSDLHPPIQCTLGWFQVSHLGQALPAPRWVTTEATQQGHGARSGSSLLSYAHAVAVPRQPTQPIPWWGGTIDLVLNVVRMLVGDNSKASSTTMSWILSQTFQITFCPYKAASPALMA